MKPPFRPRTTSLHELHSMGGQNDLGWALKRPQIITSLEWDPMSWMTSDYEVEIRARSIKNEGQRKVFCQNFGGYWNKKGSSASLKSVSTFRRRTRRAGPAAIEVTFRGLLANTIPCPLGE